MKHARWILALLMALVMVVVTIMPTFAVEGEEATDPNAATYRRVEAKKLQSRLETSVDGSRFDELKTDPETEVTAIIIFGENGANDLGEDQTATKAVNARKEMANKQNTFVKKMNAKFSAELLYNYTVLADGVAVKTKFANLKVIEAMDGVKAVYVANEYEVPKTETPDASTAADITGAGFMQYIGYAGEGTVIAVLDTGLNTTHEAFQDYGITEDTITEESAAAAGTLKEGRYLSAKVPFSYDYADDDDDVTDNNGHGTHVCGIATGYVEEEDGAISFFGSAPAAQLLMMKIFKSAASTTNSGIYFAALEDAYLLGADVINMSIGADSGFIYDYELEEELFGNIYEKLDDEGVIVSISAGNDTNMGANNISLAPGTVPTAYQDYGVVGSPSTYNGNDSIASAENAGYPSYSIEVDGSNYPYNDTATAASGMGWHDNFAGQTLEYVVGLGIGAEENYADIDVEGKIAVVARGGFTFEEKVEIAYNHGAIGCIVTNNEPGVIGMQISTFEIPAVSVTQDVGEALADSTVKELTVSEGKEFVVNPDGYYMSEFSSWGVTPSLTLKPTLTAIGGMVYAPYIGGEDTYDVMSGTSMASPNAAGCYATLVQYLRDSFPDKTKKEIADMAEGLIKSTANVWYDRDYYEYSPRSQGAGIIDLYGAIGSPVYIEEPILNLGDGLDETNQFKLDFEVTNMSNLNMAYGIMSPTVLVPYFFNLDDTHLIDTMTSDYANRYADIEWTSNWDQDIVELAPYETVDVVITVSFVEGGQMDDFVDFCFENGTFVEGYVYLAPLVAGLEYFEIEFPEAGETLWIPYGETIDEDELPEVPYMYGARGGEWDVDVTAPITADAQIYAEYDWILYGDATCGGEVDAADASAVLRHIVKLSELTEEGLENAIVTPEYGSLKSADASAILRKAVKLIEEFPIEIRNNELNGMPIRRAATRSEMELIDGDNFSYIHATFVGFYGDWTQAPALEAYDFRDVADINNYLAVTESQNMWYQYNGFGEQVVGYNEGYGYVPNPGQYILLGNNAFSAVNNQDYLLAYNEDHIAISSLIDAFLAGGWSYVNEFVTAPTQLRNCRHLIMTVTDAETGEVYYVDDTEYLPKAAYDADYGIYLQQGTFGWDGYNYNEDSEEYGNIVPSGTRVNVEYTTEIDYPGAEPKLEWAFGVDVDYTLPVIVDETVIFDEETRMLSFNITDENYLAYIAIGDENGEEIYWDAYSSDTRGDVVNIEVDLRDIATNKVIVSVVDYATNQSDYEIDTPLLETSTIESLRNRNSGEAVYTRGLVHHIDGETVYVQSPNEEVEEDDAPWGLEITLADNQMGKDLEVGQVCYIKLTPSATFELSPVSCVAPTGTLLYSMEQIAPEDIIATPVLKTADVTERLMATMIEIPAEVDTDKSNIMLTVDENIWGDGSGYQLLLDVDADTYDDVIPPVGPMTTGGALAQYVYDRFEYILPMEALVGGTAELELPAGIYDWVVINPVEGDRVWTATGGRGNDYAIEAGYTYELKITLNGSSDQVEIIKTDWSGNAESTILRAKEIGNRSIGEPLLRETFADLANWTQIDDDGDGNEWYLLNTDDDPDYTGHGPENDGQVTSASYYSGGALNPDNWLISPAVDLTQATEQFAVLSFWVQAQDAAWSGEVFGVYVSKTGNENTADFAEVYSATMSAEGPKAPTDWFKVKVDLSEYIGETIYVAFRHYDCSDMFRLNLDDVYLYTTDDESEDPEPPTPPTPVDPVESLEWTADSLDGWTQIDDDGDGNKWFLIGPDDDADFIGHGPEADGFVSSESYINEVGALYPDNWLISPPVDLTNEMLQSAKLSFWIQAMDESYPGEVFGVYVSKTGNTDTADFECIYDAEMSADGPTLRGSTDWFNVEIDMTAYLGETIYVAFRHYDCTDEYILNLDDVYLTTSEEAPEQPFPQMPYGIMIGDVFPMGDTYNGFLIDETGKLYFGENDIPMILDAEGNYVQANTETEFIPTSRMAGRFSVVAKNDNGYIIHNNAYDTLITEVGSGLPIQGLFNVSFTYMLNNYYISGTSGYFSTSFDVSTSAANAAAVVILKTEEGNWIIKVGNYYIRDGGSNSEVDATTDIGLAAEFTWDDGFKLVGTDRYLKLRQWTETGWFTSTTYTELYITNAVSNEYSTATYMTLLDLA